MADNDSRLRGARSVGLPSNTRGNFRARNDLDDLFRVQISERSSFDLKLNGIARRNNVDVELYRFKRPVADVLRSIGRIDIRALRPRQRNQNFSLVAASRKGGNRPENIASTLEADNYFIRVLKRQGTRTNYSLALTATPNPVPTPIPPAPNPNTPNPNTPNPNTPNPNPPVPSPTPLTPIPLTTQSVTSQLTATEERKRYALAVSTGDFRFKLTGLTADVDLEIRSADGNTVLNSSLNAGNVNEQLIQPLDAGSYTIDVFRKAGNAADTTFTLNYDKLTDRIGNTEAAPTFLGNIGSPTTPPTVERVNYVVAGGKDSPADVYSFTLPNRGFVTVSLSGAPIDGNTLYGDLDIELYAQGKTVQDGLSSPSVGRTVGEVFGGTLAGRNQGGAPITYLLRVIPKTGTPDGSTYKLNVNFRGVSDNPSIIRDILPGGASSDADNFVEVNGISYFSAKSVNAQGQSTTSLWASEGGTLDGTTRIFDFSGNASLSQFTNVNGKLYFVANDPAIGSGSRLWTSDGLINGTVQVTDSVTGASINGAQQLVSVGNTLYFYTEQRTGGGFISNQQLYRLQQGQATAQALTSPDFKKANGVDIPDLQDSLVNVGGTLYFAAEDTSAGRQLWRVNPGTLAIEKMLLNTEGGADPQNLIDVGGQLFLTASVEVGGFTNDAELVRINTFSTGGFNPANFQVFNLNGDRGGNVGELTYIDSTKTLYFKGIELVSDPSGDTNTGTELFKLQFTSATTENPTPTLVRDIAPGPGSSEPSELVTFGNRVIFLASEGVANELWITDGTTTSKLAQVSGLGDLASLTDIKELTIVNNNTLFFVGTNSTNTNLPQGEELWKITLNGATGTLRGYDIQVGAGSSSPNDLSVAGGQVFFVANDGINGDEPWSLPA